MPQQAPTLVDLATDACVTAELDRIGAVIQAPRRSRCESTRAFGWRLAVQIQEEIIAREQLLALVLDLTKSPKPRS